MIEYSKYKKFQKSFNNTFYNDMEEVFKNSSIVDKKGNRIYFDLTVDPKRFEIKIPNEVDEYLDWFGHYIQDRERGTCMFKGRETRIGKVLNKLEQYDLLEAYKNSRDNTLKNVNDLRVVISRHAYDIMGMSTNRGWSTCIDINDKRYNGRFLYSLRNSLNRGSLVAYLIRKGDENIENPLSRIHIKSFFNKLRSDNKIYGTEVAEFKEFVGDWVINTNKTLVNNI